MTFNQKLQISAGTLTSLTVLIDFSLFVGFILNREPRPSEANSFAIILLLVWLCSLIVAIGAYYNTVKQSNIGLTFLCVGATIVIIVLGFWSFVISIFGGFWVGLLFFAPVVLSVITVILAFSSRIKAESSRTEKLFSTL